MRRRLASSLAVLAALIASSCAANGAVTPKARDSPHTLNGVYETLVDSEFQSGALNGVWRLRLDNGAYTFNYSGKSSKNVIISGVYTVSGRRITFFEITARPAPRSQAREAVDSWGAESRPPTPSR